jgi:hypothetical protein
VAGALITVVVPVSPIKSHPDTGVLEETLDSVRHHLPSAELIVTFDGVRAEQEALRPAYEEHIRRMLWRLDKHYRNAVPFIWDEHLHQVGMLRRVIETIETPLMLWVEQDTPLTTDELIAWQPCIDLIMSGEADVVRYSHEGVIPEPHSHMMLGLEGIFMRTCQFSARPHLASVAYYRRILQSHFSADARTYTEDVMHGVCHEAYLRDGIKGWHAHRLWLYHPGGGNIKRSYHLDGRAGESKYEDQLVF